MTYEVTAGALPDGLTLDPVSGIISGTPTQSGTSAFVVSASTVFGIDRASYSLSVSSAATLPATGADPGPALALAAMLILLGATLLRRVRGHHGRQSLEEGHSDS